MTIQERYDNLAAVHEELSRAYLRIRTIVDAWNTKPGGVDRYEVTEAAVQKLKDQRAELRHYARHKENCATRPQIAGDVWVIPPHWTTCTCGFTKLFVD